MLPQQFVTVSAFLPWKGRALVLRRVTSERFLPGYWEQAGGKVEIGEHPLDAVVREMGEEAGIQVKPVGPYFVHHYVLPDSRHMIEIAVLCECAQEPQVVLSPDHQDFRWVTQEELHGLVPISDGMRRVIEEGFRVLKTKEP